MVFSKANNDFEYALVSHVIKSSRNASIQSELVLPALFGETPSEKEGGIARCTRHPVVSHTNVD